MELGVVERPRTPKGPRGRRRKAAELGGMRGLASGASGGTLLFALLLMVAWTFGGWVVFVNLGCEFHESAWRGGGAHNVQPQDAQHREDASRPLMSKPELADHIRQDELSQAERQVPAPPQEQPQQATLESLRKREEDLARDEERVARDAAALQASTERLARERAELRHAQDALEQQQKEQQQKEQQRKEAEEEEEKRRREDDLASSKAKAKAEGETATNGRVKAQELPPAKSSQASPPSPPPVLPVSPIVTGSETEEGSDIGTFKVVDLVPFVDVRRGTDNKDWRSLSHGNALPIISRPFGMTHWAVANTAATQWFFNPKRTEFVGVRCTHQPSPWIGDYGFFDVLPMLGKTFTNQKYDAEKAELRPSSMKLRIVTQCRGGACTEVEFAASTHGGMMRVVFPPGREEQGFRLDHLTNLRGSTTGPGWLTSQGTPLTATVTGESIKTTVFKVPKHTKHYMALHMEFVGEPKVRDFSATGGRIKWFSEEDGAVEVLVRIGTSFISLEQANRALDTELRPHATLATLAGEGRLAWNQLLSRVRVEADPEQAGAEERELKTMLYSCLYRALLFPRQMGEVDASGKEVHYSPYSSSGGVFPGPLSTDSGFWDAYRAVYPLLHLVFPDLVGRVMEGWVNAIREDPNHMLAQWASPGRVGSMVGSMGEASLAEAIVNGALSEESEKVAFQYMKRSALEPTPSGREFLDEYKQLGYVPHAPKREGVVSLTLNYQLSDYSVSLAARKMGDLATARTLEERAKKWRGQWDEDQQFFRARSRMGGFVSNFDPYMWMGPYTEGGPWQYRFYVPHDAKGLREAYESKRPSSWGLRGQPTESRMCEVLKEAMTGSNRVSNRQKIHEELEMVEHSFGQYSHNNQPVHHVLYMFAHAGCPLEGQKWMHHTLRSQYGAFGFAGDEDNGEMSSWYLLTSLGLYALVPGSGEYQLGAPPLFRRVVVHREQAGGRGAGKLEVSRAPGLQAHTSPLATFTPATSARWNGRSIDLSQDAATIPYSDLLAGGRLEFVP